ncbi:hypothetical protein Tco_0243137 [Tanacetum coccineum]
MLVENLSDKGESNRVPQQWTGILDLVEVCLKDSCMGYRRLDGTMSVIAQDKAVKDFNTLPEKRKREMVESAFGDDKNDGCETRLSPLLTWNIYSKHST